MFEPIIRRFGPSLLAGDWPGLRISIQSLFGFGNCRILIHFGDYKIYAYLFYLNDVYLSLSIYIYMHVSYICLCLAIIYYLFYYLLHYL